MRKFNIFTVFFIIVVFTANFVSMSASALSDPEMEAESALLVETKSGKILYEKNIDERIDFRSASNIMTLLLAVEAVEKGQATLKDEITASETFLEDIGDNAVTLGIMPGEKLLFDELMYAVFLDSAADACSLLAERIGGSTEKFIAQMNKRAISLGCSNTNFTVVGGSAQAGQYTTAWDQYIIYKEAVRHNLFMTMAGTISYYMTASATSPERYLTNTNALLANTTDLYYPNCRTSMAGVDKNHLIAYAKNDALSLISVVIGKESAEDTTQETPVDYKESIRLLDWGFSSFGWKNVINREEITVYESIDFAKGNDTLGLRPTDSVAVLVSNDLLPKDIKKEVVIFGKKDGENLKAPVRAGEILGIVTVYVEGQPSGKTRLAAAQSVELDRPVFVKSYISETLSHFWVQLTIFLLLLMIGGYAWLVIRDYIHRREKKKEILKAKQKIIEERRERVKSKSELK